MKHKRNPPCSKSFNNRALKMGLPDLASDEKANWNEFLIDPSKKLWQGGRVNVHVHKGTRLRSRVLIKSLENWFYHPEQIWAKKKMQQNSLSLVWPDLVWRHSHFSASGMKIFGKGHWSAGFEGGQRRGCWKGRVKNGHPWPRLLALASVEHLLPGLVPLAIFRP